MVSSSSREAGRAAAKIFPDLAALAVHVDSLRAAGKRIVLAHGVFDLLHVGHIRHLREAREQGDVLVVTLTEDRHVNKGPNRPAFTESLRAEALAALEYVDAVTVNRTPTAIDAINALRPDVYVKGPDYKQPAQDVTGGIAREADAVLAAGGVVHITEDLTFSSSALINRYLPTFTADVEAYLASFRGRHSAADVVAAIDKLRDMRVVVIGETILDEYVYVDQMGKSAKDPVLAMRYSKTETYPGGALAVANHLAEFCHSVELITYLGSTDDHEKFVRSNLKPKIRANFIYKSDSPTIVKRRYVEATLNSKLFEVYVINDDALNAGDDADLCAMIDARVQSADAIVCADFGHGLISPTAKQRLGACGRFLAVNTQINAANIRYHAISSYARADYVCINEGELRLDARNRHDGVDDLVRGLAGKLACERFMVTRGSQGVMYYDGASAYPSPSLTTRVVDRIGSGDAVLALTSVGIAAGMPADIVAFFANVIGAQAVEVMGNRSSIGRVQTLKFIDALLK